MPTIQIPGIKDPVSFPDDLTHEQLVDAVDNAWKSQFNEDEVDFQRGRLGSAAASFGRAVTEGIGQVVSGLGRVESMLTAGAAQPEGEAYTSPEDRQRIQAESPISKAGEAIQQGAKEAYRTNPKYQGEFLAETLPQALGSTAISAAAAGVGGPLVGGAAYGLMSGEQAAKEAEDAGKPEQADIAFMLNAPVGALSESLLGAGPRFWKTVKAVREAGVEPAKAIPSLLKIAAKSSAYEGTQEGVEQLAQNAIAQRLYDPNRPITQGVAESVKAGAAVGGLLGGAGGVIGQIDSKVAKAEIATKTAEEGAPATGLAILQTPTPATDITPSIDVSGIQQEVEKLNSLIEEAKGLQAQGQSLTDEQAKQIAVLEKSRPKGEMIEAAVDQPAAPAVEPAQPTEQTALPEEQPTTQPSNADQIKSPVEVVSGEPTGPAPQVAEGITSGDVQAAGTKVEEKGAGVQEQQVKPIKSIVVRPNQRDVKFKADFPNGSIEVDIGENTYYTDTDEIPNMWSDNLTAYFPTGEIPKGTGIATELYIDALAHVKKQKGGWVSDAIRSDETERIYKRLIDAGVPFEKVDNSWVLWKNKLSKLSLKKVRENLAKKYSKQSVSLKAQEATLPTNPKTEVPAVQERKLTRQFKQWPKGTVVQLTGERIGLGGSEAEVIFPDGEKRGFPDEWLTSGAKRQTLSQLIQRLGRDEINILLNQWESGAELSPDGKSILVYADARNKTGKTKASAKEFTQWLADYEAQRSTPSTTSPATSVGVQPEVKAEVQPEIPSVSQAESKLASIVNDAVAQEDVRKSKGLGISPTATTRSSDVVIGPKDLTSVSQVVEERWNDALRKKETLLDKVTDTLTSAYRSMTRTHAELDPVTFAKEEDIFRRLSNSRNMAARQAVDVLKGITKNVGPKQYSVFNRVIVLEDLLKDVESGLYSKGQQLPFGYANEIELRADLDKFRSIAEATPQIKQALERRNEFMNSLRDTLVERGILPESVKEDPRYFHHQVLLYMAEKNAGSGSRNFRDWFSGWQKSRVGSSLDYNRQYVEAEASMIADAFNKMALQDYQAEMKAAADISDSLKTIHGKEWRQHLPTGYKLWQPKRGTIFYPAHTVAENVMENYLNGLGDILPEQFKQALVVGGPREQWAIPAELAKVLDTLTPPASRGFARLAEAMVQGWKRYILYNPLRFLKFEINNQSGDVDFVLAASPYALKYWKQAAKDVYSIHAKGTIPTGDVRQAMKDAVIGSGWKQSELPNISADEAFSWITGEKKGLIDRYWDFVGKINDIREDGLRLAVYRHAINQWKNGKNFYGASNPFEVDKLATPELKAAKVAREMMIDYGRSTEFSDYMRRRVVPFWKWAEGNFGRYIQLMKNASIEGSPSVGDVAGLAVRRGVAKTAVAGAFTAASSALLYGMINLWNHLKYPQEEEELGDARNQLHLITGRHPDGTVSTLRIQGSLSDVLEWFDLADFPNDISQVASGKASIADKANDAWKAAISKLVNGAQPFVKTGYEIATKRSLYPDITHPRPIRDRAEHLARLFSLGNIYKYFAGIPQSPQNKALYSLITYNVDPGEAAYNTTRHMVSEFLKKNGKEPTDYTPTAKSNALYYYKQAIRYKDNALADKWLKEYYDLGGKSEGITQSISRSSPTSSLGRLKGQFYDSLSPSEKAIVDRADDWFRKVYQR